MRNRTGINSIGKSSTTLAGMQPSAGNGSTNNSYADLRVEQGTYRLEVGRFMLYLSLANILAL